MGNDFWQGSRQPWAGMSRSGRLAARQLTAWSLCAMVGMSSAIAFTAVLSTPQVAQAYTARVSLFLSRTPGESYETFLRRAEAIARAAIQRSFDADLLATEVVVTVVGENQGVSIPIMEVQVTRNEWRERPDPQCWARYYESAPTLLSF